MKHQDKIDQTKLLKDYPIQDDTWPSRRWNKEMTDYIDLSGEGESTPIDMPTAEEMSHFGCDEKGNSTIVPERKSGEWKIVRTELLIDDTGRYMNAIRDESQLSVSNMHVCKVYGTSIKTCNERTALIAQAPAMYKLLQWISRATNNPEIGIKCDAIIKKANPKQ